MGTEPRLITPASDHSLKLGPTTAKKGLAGAAGGTFNSETDTHPLGQGSEKVVTGARPSATVSSGGAGQFTLTIGAGLPTGATRFRMIVFDANRNVKADVTNAGSPVTATGLAAGTYTGIVRGETTKDSGPYSAESAPQAVA